jgi:hypothetical protein
MVKMKNIVWTKAEERLLVELRKEKMLWMHVAARLRRSLSSCKAKYASMGMHPPKQPKAKKEPKKAKVIRFKLPVLPKPDLKANNHPEFLESAAGANAVTFLGLNDKTCRWPHGTLFCGDLPTHGAYCEKHHKIATRKS